MNKSKNAKKVIAVTGAGGFIGQAIIKDLLQRGHRVVALVRDPKILKERLPMSNLHAHHCELPNQIDLTFLQHKPEVLIHCAFHTKFENKKIAHAVNILGSENLIKICRQNGIKVIFISSMSSHEEATSHYGRMKFQVEQMLTGDRDLILRPGFVIGEGGVFRRLREMIASSPAIPLLWGGRQPVQTIWLNDLVTAVGNALEQEAVGLYTLAHPKVWDLRDFYLTIAKSRNKIPRFVRVPGGLMLFLARNLEILKIPFPISSENILGMKQLKSCDTRQAMQEFRVHALSLNEALGKLSASD